MSREVSPHRSRGRSTFRSGEPTIESGPGESEAKLAKNFGKSREHAMGGFGSTRWNWVSTKDTVDGNRSLDINHLNRAGCLRPGYSGGWEWTRAAGPDTTGPVDRHLAGTRSRQPARHHGEEWRDVEQPTPIVWRPCRFGGARPFFVCPGVINGIACGPMCCAALPNYFYLTLIH
jgi:hypothetical protein